MNRFKLSIEIATRFLSTKTRGNFLSFITGVSIIGVCVGVLALLIVTSVVNGFESKLVKVVTETQGDVIFYTRAAPIRDKVDLEKKIWEFAPNIETITGSYVAEVMYGGPNGVAGGMLEGFDPKTFSSVVSMEDRLEKGSVMPQNEGEIIIGSALADKLGVKRDDSVRVIIPFSGAEEEENQGFGSPRVQDFKVVGIVHLGMYDYDSKYAYAPITSVQQLVFNEPKDYITSFRMKLKDFDQSENVANELSKHFGFPYRVREWSQLNKNLLYAIKLEKAVISVLLTAIMIVAAFNVISALLMLVYEKEKEISILRVVGMRRSDLFFLFSFVGSFFGMMGTLFGVLAGLVSVFVLRETHFIHLPAEIYHLEYLPVVIRYTEWGSIVLMSFVICMLATVGPAARISRRSPIEGLRWTT